MRPSCGRCLEGRNPGARLRRSINAGIVFGDFPAFDLQLTANGRLAGEVGEIISCTPVFGLRLIDSRPRGTRSPGRGEFFTRPGPIPSRGGEQRSTSDRPSTGIRDTHTLDLDRRAVQAERLSHHHCEPVEHKRCQRLAREPMTEFKHVFDSAARTAGKQLKRLAPFRVGLRFSRQPRP
jgi:hypothetical protein